MTAEDRAWNSYEVEVRENDQIVAHARLDALPGTGGYLRRMDAELEPGWYAIRFGDGTTRRVELLDSPEEGEMAVAPTSESLRPDS